MDKTQQKWEKISTPFNAQIAQAILQQHHAAQFMAMAGKYLIPEKEDDSHTNIEYFSDENRFLGNPLPSGHRVALDLNDLSIQFLDKNGLLEHSFKLAGKTKEEGFHELKKVLENLGIDVSGLRNQLHYKIPSHKLDEGARFDKVNSAGFVENSVYRHNAKIILNEIALLFEQDEPIKVWPHHFDTEAFYTISKNERGDATQTIGIGFAIPDSMVNEPYFYLSFWSAEALNTQDKLWPIDAGKWLLPDWNGAVLKLLELIQMDTANKQFELVKAFYHSGIRSILEAMN